MNIHMLFQLNCICTYSGLVIGSVGYNKKIASGALHPTKPFQKVTFSIDNIAKFLLELSLVKLLPEMFWSILVLKNFFHKLNLKKSNWLKISPAHYVHLKSTFKISHTIHYILISELISCKCLSLIYCH